MSIYVGVNEKIEFVDYIESTGTQWIDTEFKPNQNTRFLIDFEILEFEIYKNVFGSFGGPKGTNKLMFLGMNGTDGFYSFFGGIETQFNIPVITRYTADFNKNVLSIGSSSYTFPSATFQSEYNAFIFSSPGYDGIASGRPKMKLYSCKIYNNGNLIRDFKPCKNNGVYCLYDTVSTKCYFSKGSDNFLGGELTGEILEFNKAKNVKKIYAGIENLAKTVRKGYIGVAGTARRFFNSIKEISYYGELEDLPVATSYIGSAGNSNYAIFSGGEFNGTVYDACYAYDSNLTRVTATSLSTKRAYLAGVRLGNYAIFAGGMGVSPWSTSGCRDAVDVYDSNLTRVTATSLSKARFNLAGVSIGDYAVFAGGTNYSAYQSGVDGYNTNLVRSTSSLQYYGRTELAGASVGGYAVFAGGSGSSTYNSSEAFNSSLTRTILSSLSQSKYRLGGTSTTNYAIFAGGSSSTSSVVALKSVDAYDATLTKTVAGELSVARSRLGSVTLGGKAMFIGGNNGSSDLKAVDIYNDDLTKNSSELTANSCNLKGANIGDYVVLTGSWNKKVYAYVYN